MTGSGACPACPTQTAPAPVETHLDRIGGKEYRVVRCAACGVVFSLPREAVGPEWYEKAAPIRDREAHHAPADDWRFRQFFAEGLPLGRLLDVGCGDGGFLGLAKERGFAVAGFDYERRMVGLARARGIADAESAEFSEYCRRRKAGEFDCVTLFDVLEHAPEPGRFLGELKRLLKPGGHLVVTLPNADRPIPFAREEHDYPPHHFTRWSPGAMRAFLERNGFEVTRQEASDLKVSYLSDHLFFYALMPRVLGFARLLLFGRASSGATISELYEKPVSSGNAAAADFRARLRGALADKYRRQRVVNAFNGICRLFTWPVAWLMALGYRVRRPQCGDCLYTIARLKPEGKP